MTARQTIVLQPPEVNFTNILRECFTLADPKQHKKYILAISLFCAFGVFRAEKLLVKC